MKKETKPQNKTLWLIWSFEHNAWWGKNWLGYTENIKEAGRYTYHEARAIVWSANYGCYNRPNEAMVQDYIGPLKK